MDIESYLKKQARTKAEVRQLIGELSARQLPTNEIKELFLPKKEHYAKIHLLKKSPLKLNAVSAHCISESRQEKIKLNLASAKNDENGG